MLKKVPVVMSVIGLAASLLLPNLSVVHATQLAPTPNALSSIRGMAFLDLNANGRRDAKEPSLSGFWFKITDGGAWFSCGFTGKDSSYSLPVKTGTYYVMGVSPKGYRTTTPRIRVDVTSTVPVLNVNIGFVADSAAPLEGCDQYKPARPGIETISATLNTYSTFNTLLAAAKSAGLSDTLANSGPLTIFAPTDAAFAKLPIGVLDSLLKDPKKLADVLTYHIVSGRLTSLDITKMSTAIAVNGKRITISRSVDGMQLNGVNIIRADIDASNGIVHVIDAVLFPPAK